MTNKKLPNTVGASIRDTRISKGMTPAQLATSLGVSRTTVVRYELGKQNLSLETIERIAKALDCEVVVLFQPR